MRKFLAILLIAAMMLSMAACSSTVVPETQPAAEEVPVETTEIPIVFPEEPVVLTVWGEEGDGELLAQLAEDFKAAYPDRNFDIRIEVKSAAEAKDAVLAEPEQAADVFVFTDDQLPELAEAGALMPMNEEVSNILHYYTGKNLDMIYAQTSEVSTLSSMWNGVQYAFPMGGVDNFVLLYDPQKISPEAVSSWDTLLSAAEESRTKLGMTYNSYCLATGFGTVFQRRAAISAEELVDVNKNLADDLADIIFHPAVAAVDDQDMALLIDNGVVGAIVLGSWDVSTAYKALYKGYCAAKLPVSTDVGKVVINESYDRNAKPEITVDEEQTVVTLTTPYATITMPVEEPQIETRTKAQILDPQKQLPEYLGYELLGVNARTDNPGWALLLAEFLTNEESQYARYNLRKLTPANVYAAAESIQPGLHELCIPEIEAAVARVESILRAKAAALEEAEALAAAEAQANNP